MCPTPTLLRFILKIHLDYTWVTLWYQCRGVQNIRLTEKTMSKSKTISK